MSEVVLEVQFPAAKVHVDSRRMKRNFRRGGRTMQAAVRLALYRLRVEMRRLNVRPVDDVYVGMDRQVDLLVENAAVVFAEVRAMRFPDWFEGELHVPPGTSQITLATMEGINI